MALWRVRATIDDRPGFLSVLAASLALRSVNILAVQVHASEAGAIDDFLVDAPGEMTEPELLAAVERGRGREAWVARADAHTLVDAPTRALDLAGRVVREPAAVGEVLADLLDARVTWSAEFGPAAAWAGLDSRRMCLPAAGGGAWLADRAGPSFTPAEYARAQSLVAVAAATGPYAPGVALLLPDGREVTLRRAVSGDLPAVRGLHDRCTPATLRRRYPYRGAPSDDGLRRLLVPERGWALLATVPAPGGEQAVGMASLVAEGDQVETALLVEDAWQRRGIGTAFLRRARAGAAEAGYAALLSYAPADNAPMVRTLRRLAGERALERDDGMVTATIPLHSDASVAPRSDPRRNDVNGEQCPPAIPRARS